MDLSDYSLKVVKDAKSYIKENKDIIFKYFISSDTRIVKNPLLMQILTYLIKNINKENEDVFSDLIINLQDYLNIFITHLTLLEKDLKTLENKNTIDFYLDLIVNISLFKNNDEEENVLMKLEDKVLDDIYKKIDYTNECINDIYNDLEKQFKREYEPFFFKLERIADELDIIHNFNDICVF